MQTSMNTLTPSGVLSLSVAERIQLVEDIWDTIAEVPDEVGLTDSQKAEIDRRLDAYHRSPEEGAPWDMVRKRILSRQ
jgi:putative addiction module component (TIGR02574 family)